MWIWQVWSHMLLVWCMKNVYKTTTVRFHLVSPVLAFCNIDDTSGGTLYEPLTTFHVRKNPLKCAIITGIYSIVATSTLITSIYDFSMQV